MRSALRHPNFLPLVSASTALSFGYWIGFVCSGLLVVRLAVAEGHPERASFYGGLVGLETGVPVISLSLVAGAFAATFGLRPVLATAGWVLVTFAV